MPSRTEPRVLLLDAHLRHSLAIARSLGQRGIPVVAASSELRFPARYSRYVERALLLAKRPSADELLNAISTAGAEVLIAGGLDGNEAISRHRTVLEDRVRAPFNDLATFEVLSNKTATLALADTLGVAHPVSFELTDPSVADEAATALGFPLVLKSPLDQGTVAYAHSIDELHRLVGGFFQDFDHLVRRGVYPVAQQYIEGEGHGFYGLAQRGEILAYFMHRRVHEVPPTGGPSGMATSYRDSGLLELGSAFFSATEWTGVAMVEFKRRARDGAYFLLEVNPKFWGSLDLSIAAGVDFPQLLYDLLTRGRLDHVLGEYRDDLTFRWLTMDLAYAVATRSVASYLTTFRDCSVQDDLRRDDLWPTLALFATGMQRLAQAKLRRGRSGGPADAASDESSDAGAEQSSAPLKLFYVAKPLIPRSAQVAARRIRAQRIWASLGGNPVARLPTAPLGYRWPNGHVAGVLITHDVETSVGQANVSALTRIEAEYGIRSCWNFVIRRYPVDLGVLQELRDAGHEIGLHGVYHDGKKFDSDRIFDERLAIMTDAAQSWGAVGFRSPSLLYKPSMLERLPFEWDSSMPAWDPFQPKPGDCGSYTPFLLNEFCVELPVTLWQDFTLFEELRMTDVDIWDAQIRAIYGAGGLINVIVHPDYVLSGARLDLYRALLERIVSLEEAWIAVPSEVASWERHQRPNASLETDVRTPSP